MSSNLELLRKQDLSVYYWLSDLFTDSPFISIKSEYESSELTPPSIAIETGVSDGEVYELGNRNILISRIYYFDINANNISQRNDYAYKIFSSLHQNAIPVYDYDEGFPPGVSPTQIGNLLYRQSRITPLYIDTSENESSYFRSVVMYMANYETRT